MSDGKVEVGIGETIGGVVGDGIGRTTNNPEISNEFKSGKDSRQNCADSTNVSNDNHGEVKIGDINENKEKLYDGEVSIDSSDLNGEVQNQGAVVEYIPDMRHSSGGTYHYFPYVKVSAMSPLGLVTLFITELLILYIESEKKTN